MTPLPPRGPTPSQRPGPPPRFITLEGGDGVGKSTQIARLAARLAAAGVEVVTTREPGGSAKAEAIRGLLLSGAVAPFGPSAEAAMFAAARIDHLDTLIRPALARGAWVISDRFSDSTRAYQGAAGHVEAAVIGALEQIAVGRTRPDLTLVLDIPGDVGLRRAAARRSRTDAPDRFEAQDGRFHGRLRQAFLAIAEAEPERCVVVDAMGTIDAVAETVWDAVRTRLVEPGRAAAA